MHSSKIGINIDITLPCRRELTALHVAGVTPPIKFIKDNSNRNQAVVEDLLKTADFGPDFVPTDIAAPLRSHAPNDEFVEPKKLQQTIKHIAKSFEDPLAGTPGPGGSVHVQEVSEAEIIQKLEKQAIALYPERFKGGHSEKESEEPEELPGFGDMHLRSDVYDIKHDEMLNQVVQTKKRLSRFSYQPEAGEVQKPPEMSPTKSPALINNAILNKVLEDYRRKHVPARMRERKERKRPHCKHNLGIEYLDTVLD